MSVSDSYVPGQCNIGSDEIARRWWLGVAATVVAVATFAGLLAIKAAPAWHLVLMLPAGGAASGFLQARARFCFHFGMRGRFNFGRLGSWSGVGSEAARRADAGRSRRLLAQTAAIGVGVAVVAVGIASGIGTA